MAEAIRKKKILREHLRMVKTPANMWFTTRPPARWYRLVLTKTQERRQQRMQAKMRHHWEKAKGMRLNT